MRFFHISLLLLFLLSIIACDDNNSGNNSVFPLQSGNEWVYKNKMTYTNASPRNATLPADDSLQINTSITKKVELSNGESAYEQLSVFYEGDSNVGSSRTYYQDRSDGLYIVASGDYAKTNSYNIDDIPVRLGPKTFANVHELKQYLTGINSLYRSKSDSISLLDSPQLVFKYPLKEGTTWVYYDDSMFKIEKTVTGKMTVETPAGTFDCWVLKWKYYSDFGAIDNVLMIEYLCEDGIIGQVFTYTHVQLPSDGDPLYADYEENMMLQSYSLMNNSANPVK